MIAYAAAVKPVTLDGTFTSARRSLKSRAHKAPALHQYDIELFLVIHCLDLQ